MCSLTKPEAKMSNSSIQTLLSEVHHLTRLEKIELLNSLTIQLKDSSVEPDLNLADFFQNSPLVGANIDLTRQVDVERREVWD
jgi:hypothetical protein